MNERDVYGKAQVVQVEHHPQLWEVAADEAVVYDAYISTGYNVDVHTHVRVASPDDDLTDFWMAYQMKPIGDTWKVVDSVQISNHDEITPVDNGD